MKTKRLFMGEGDFRLQAQQLGVVQLQEHPEQALAYHPEEIKQRHS